MRSHARRSAPTPRRFIGAPNKSGVSSIFEHVESDEPVHHINQTAWVKHNVIALWRGAPGHRLRNEMANLARRHRVGHVDDAQAATEPYGVNQRAGHALVVLVRAEARARRAGKWRIELAHLEQ